MTTKAQLVKELDDIVTLTATQTEYYLRSNQYLYEGFARVYLWWLKAKSVKGFLEEQYAKNNIGGKEHKQEKFTRVLRLTWRLDWANESKAKLQQWSLALREIDKEYTTNKDAYRTEPQKKIVNFIVDKGGLRRLIGADKYDVTDSNTETKSKRKAVRTVEDDAEIEKRHIELGEEYFQNARAISNIQSTKPIAVNRKGYALAIIRRKKNDTYDVLATVSDDTQIKKAIVAGYKRSNSVAPTALRLLVEVIQTQSLPITLEKHRYSLPDAQTVTTEEGKSLKIRQNKRLLFRKKQGDILLSENRTGCSVVTIAKPHTQVLASSKDVFLNVNDRRYLEQAIIQRNDLNLYTTNDKDKVPVLRDTDAKASHRLIVDNKVLNKKRAVYFYTIDTVGEHSRPQADKSHTYKTKMEWMAKVDKLWFERMYAQFVNGWLNEYGEHVTRAKHKAMRLEAGRASVTLKHYGEKGNFSHSSVVDVDGVTATSKPTKATFQTKDLLPVLSGLNDIEMVGKATLAMNADVLVIKYATELASYEIYVPTCKDNLKRVATAFETYGG